jgi:ABC-type cobalamin transport system permease subunit
MEELKIFLNHLYFSAICVVVGAIAIYAILAGIGRQSIISNNLLATGMICGALCSVLTVFFTYRSLKIQLRRPIVRTRRQP